LTLTKAGEYGIRAMRFLASHKEKNCFSIGEIASAEDIPIQFLAKLMQKLCHAGLVKSLCGKKGGYRIAKDPSKITLKDILFAMEGPVFLNECLAYPKICRFNPECKVHKVWKEAQEAMLGILSRYTLKDVLQNGLHEEPKKASRKRQKASA
jgi:Rrf2 family protein